MIEEMLGDAGVFHTLNSNKSYVVESRKAVLNPRTLTRFDLSAPAENDGEHAGRCLPLSILDPTN